jgi:hypothetical protein
VGHVRDIAFADDDRGFAQGGGRIALDDRRAAGEVAGRVEVRVVAVVGDPLVDERRAGSRAASTSRIGGRSS